MAVRVRRRHPTIAGRNREFDVVVTSQDYVLINETKSSLDAKDVSKFADNMAEAREFFPEYIGRHFIGAIASLYVEEGVVTHGQKQGLIVLGFGEDVMEVLNTPDFAPKKF